MYISRIIFTIKAGEQATFEKAVNSIIKVAQAMPGCSYFGLSVLVNEPTKYLLYEEWDTKQHAEAFKASKETNDAVAQLSSVMGGAPVVVEHLFEL